MFDLAEVRLVQERLVTSAANAEQLNLTPVPAGKVWIITGAGYSPDVSETRVINWEKITASGATYGLLNPISQALFPARSTFIEQGMLVYLFPGEYIVCRRDDHTLGSVMNIWLQFVEIDLPLYHYEEPQVVLRQTKAISTIRQQLGGGAGRGSLGPGPSPGSRGSGGSGPAMP